MAARRGNYNTEMKMYRFIRIGSQINEDEPFAFAFFDTCTNSFIEVEGEQYWESYKDWEEFIDGYKLRDLPQVKRMDGLIPGLLKKFKE